MAGNKAREENRKAWESWLQQLEQRRARALEMGGPERLARLMYDRGKLDARQRIERLFDAGSFVELGQLVGSIQDLPGDGYVCGLGRIGGRPVLGTYTDRERVVAEQEIEKVVVAVPDRRKHLPLDPLRRGRRAGGGTLGVHPGRAGAGKGREGRRGAHGTQRTVPPERAAATRAATRGTRRCARCRAEDTAATAD